MIVYALVKYLVYSLWCYVGLRLFGSQITSVRPATTCSVPSLSATT